MHLSRRGDGSCGPAGLGRSGSWMRAEVNKTSTTTGCSSSQLPRQQPDCSFLLWTGSAGNRWCWPVNLRCVQHVARLAASFKRPFSSRCGPRQLLLLLNGPGRLSALMQISPDESEERKQLSDFWKSPCCVKLLDRRNPPGVCFWWGFSACLFCGTWGDLCRCSQFLSTF